MLPRRSFGPLMTVDAQGDVTEYVDVLSALMFAVHTIRVLVCQIASLKG